MASQTQVGKKERHDVENKSEDIDGSYQDHIEGEKETASQSIAVTKLQKTKRILQVNLETGEEHYETENQSVDLIELIDDETNENHVEVEEEVNEEKTESFPEPTHIKTVHSTSGESFLDRTESWSQSFCHESPPPSPVSPDNSQSIFQRKTQSLTRHLSNEPLLPYTEPTSPDDSSTFFQNKTQSLTRYLSDETLLTYPVPTSSDNSPSLFKRKTQRVTRHVSNETLPSSPEPTSPNNSPSISQRKTQRVTRNLSNETLLSSHKPTSPNNSPSIFQRKTQRVTRHLSNETLPSSPEPTSPNNSTSIFSNETLPSSPEHTSPNNSPSFFPNITHSLVRSLSNATPPISPVSGLLDDTITLSGKTTQHKTASAVSYLTSTPARSRCLVQDVNGCGESLDNPFPQSPILECSYALGSPHPSESHSKTIDEECPPRKAESCSSGGEGQVPSDTEVPGLVGQIIHQNKAASCPICYMVFLMGDLEVHASGCEGAEEEGFVGMSQGFLCGYCLLHVKDEEENMEEHLEECKVVKEVDEAQVERDERKMSLRRTVKGVDKEERKKSLGRTVKGVEKADRKRSRKRTSKKSIQSLKNVSEKKKGKTKERNEDKQSNFRRSTQSFHRQMRNSIEKPNPSTSRATLTIIDDVCIPSTSKMDDIERTSSRPDLRKCRINLSRIQTAQKVNSENMNLSKDRDHSPARRGFSGQIKKTRLMSPSCPLCSKHWLMIDLELHASGCLGEVQDDILNDGDEREIFMCGYCSMSVQAGEDDKENHLISCRKNMTRRKWEEGAKEKMKALRSCKKKK